LVWVYPEYIRTALNAVPRLEMTKEMRRLGWTTDLIAVGPRGTQLAQGVEVLCFPWPKMHYVRYAVYHGHVVLYMLQNWRSIDIVLFTPFSAPWIFPLRLLRIFSKKRPVLVMDTRTVAMDAEDQATFRQKFRAVFLAVMKRSANRWADGQTAITQRMAEHLRIPPNKLWGTWPSGVDAARFSAARPKRKWPDSGGPVIIVYIGTLSYERNLMSLGKAVVESNRQGMNFELLLYGEGTEKRDLEAYAGRADGSVKVHGAIPHDQVPGLLARAHVGTLPFPDEEKYRVSSPIKLFEYLGSGMPILATRIVCHTDVLGNADYVFWAEGSDGEALLRALRQVWKNRLQLSILGEKALGKARDCTWAASAERLDHALNHGLASFRR